MGKHRQGRRWIWEVSVLALGEHKHRQAEAAAVHSEGHTAHRLPAAAPVAPEQLHTMATTRFLPVQREGEQGHRAAEGSTSSMATQLLLERKGTAHQCLLTLWRRKPTHTVDLCLQGALFSSVCTQSGSRPATERHTR